MDTTSLSILMAALTGLTSLVSTVILLLIRSNINQTLGRVNDKIESNATLMNRDIDTLRSSLASQDVEIRRLRKSVHWHGNCLLVMASKMEVTLPKKDPSEDDV